ncbi:MAG: hypothetical protein AAGG48_19370 [Planctomycetota bacterium]
MLNENERAWIQDLADRPGEDAMRALNHVRASETKLDELFNGLAEEWLTPGCMMVGHEVDVDFCLSVELMNEDAQVIHEYLDHFGDSLTEEDLDEICTVIFCRIGFMASSPKPRVSSEDKEHEMLTSALRRLLSPEFRAFDTDLHNK